MKASPGPRSSSTRTPQPDAGGPDARTRQGFALTGPSVGLDPRTHAVRGDLADLRLADRVFAPHYAAAMSCVVGRATPLVNKAKGGDQVALLAPGDRFELLELSGRHAWGIAVGPGLVGYCDRDALELM